MKRYSRTKNPRRGFFPLAAVFACATIALVVGVGMNVVSAGANDTTASTLGLDETSSLGSGFQDSIEDNFAADEGSVLAKSASRNIDKAVNEMLEREEAERRAAEEARLAAEAAKKAELDALQARSAGDAASAGLDPVDWTLSHDEFVDYWGERIEVFLAGFPLAGQGRTFAEAAWNYGVDPRLSPAISNTESTRGLHCSVSCNAWGWGPHIPFSSWEEAIDTHVRGLKNCGYGPMITYAGAQRYCPPTADDWYRKTVYAMGQI